MARLTDKTELTAVADDDLLHVVDVSDTTGSASGTSKKATSENVVLDVLGASKDVNGDITVAGSISSRKLGTFAYLATAEDTTITVAETYYPIAGTFTNAPSEGFTGVATPALRYDGLLTQYFEIDWHTTLSGNSNNITVHLGVKLNGTFVQSSRMGTFLKNTGEPYVVSGTTVVELSTNDEVQLVITSDGSGDVITIYHYTTTISEFFD